MEKQSGWALRAGLALLSLLCASAAFGQMYEPDDEEAIPPAPIPRAHMHPHPMYDPGDEPPEPDPDRFPRRGARMMPGDEVDRLPLPPPPPPMERSGPRPMPMPLEPGFDRLPPRERNSARLMTPGPLAEAPHARPRAIVPPVAPKELQMRNEQIRATHPVANIADSKAKVSAKPAASVRNENPPARVASPPPPRPATAAQNPAPAPAPAPVAVQMTRAPDTMVRPRSDLDNISGFVNKGEGKFNLEK